MPGKFCNGRPSSPSKLRESRAHCEGRQAAEDGLLITDNPWVEEQSHIDWAAWALGFVEYGSNNPVGCCADTLSIQPI